MKKYTKIETVYAREKGTKKLLEGEFVNPRVEMLKDCEWRWTEKIDGMNIRVFWDGYCVTLAGRKDDFRGIDDIPSELADRLKKMFLGEETEQMFEQLFGEKEVMLIGEGYGEKIQTKGVQKEGLYRKGCDFILFDVMVNGMYLERKNVLDIAESFGIECVPEIFTGSIEDAVSYIKGHPMSVLAPVHMEGIVGRLPYEITDKTGHRIIVKMKYSDFF